MWIVGSWLFRSHSDRSSSIPSLAVLEVVVAVAVEVVVVLVVGLSILDLLFK